MVRKWCVGGVKHQAVGCPQQINSRSRQQAFPPASGLRLQKILGFGTGSLILELRSIQEKRTYSPDNLIFGQVGLAKNRAGGQAGKVQLSWWVVVVVKRKNALARLMICFSDKPG